MNIGKRETKSSQRIFSSKFQQIPRAQNFFFYNERVFFSLVDAHKYLCRSQRNPLVAFRKKIFYLLQVEALQGHKKREEFLFE